MSKIISCGILVTDGDNLLICLPTGGTRWNLPKGRQEPGETLAETAVRETFEETGLQISAADITDLGRFRYRPGKDLHLFEHRVKTMPDVSTLQCVSEFTEQGRTQPEMSDFAVVSIKQARTLLNPNLSKIVCGIFRKKARQHAQGID